MNIENFFILIAAFRNAFVLYLDVFSYISSR